jgi:hypothetical protein
MAFVRIKNQPLKWIPREVLQPALDKQAAKIAQEMAAKSAMEKAAVAERARE